MAKKRNKGNAKESCSNNGTDYCVQKALGQKTCRNGTGIIIIQTKGNSGRVNCKSYIPSSELNKYRLRGLELRT